RRRWKVEPGRSIRARILAFVTPLQFGNENSSDAIFQMLDGLPFRNEVPSGRDFRGGGCGKGIEQDFADSDFSYSSNVFCFRKCNLSRSKFDECNAEPQSFMGSFLRDCSFRKVRFRGTFFMNVDAQNACFDEASLIKCRFDEADLSGASFR